MFGFKVAPQTNPSTNASLLHLTPAVPTPAFGSGATLAATVTAGAAAELCPAAAALAGQATWKPPAGTGAGGFFGAASGSFRGL